MLGEAGAGVLDDFRELRLHRGGREEVVRTKRDKGHARRARGVRCRPAGRASALARRGHGGRDARHVRDPRRVSCGARDAA